MIGGRNIRHTIQNDIADYQGQGVFNKLENFNIFLKLKKKSLYLNV